MGGGTPAGQQGVPPSGIWGYPHQDWIGVPPLPLGLDGYPPPPFGTGWGTPSPPSPTLSEATDQALATRRVVCLLRSRRRTFLFGHYFGTFKSSFCICSSDSGNAYMITQGIEFSTAWDLWENIVALVCMTIIFLILSYIQLRRIKKYK